MATRTSRTTPAVASQVRATFAAKSVLTRYVDEVQRLRGSRPASDAFRRNPGADHLSVNLVGVETLSEIVSYYREQFQGNAGKVAVCQHHVYEYNTGCSRTSVRLTYNTSQSMWEFADHNGKSSPAYRLRPFTPRGSRPSQSHSGVEYVRVFDELSENRFARHMCNKRFHLL